jgi:hypothetical protein
MERETKELTTPGGHKAIIKTYLTAREANEIKEVFNKAISMHLENGQIVSDAIPATVLSEQEKKVLALLLVSLDGDANNIYERLLDFKQEDYEFLVAEANNIQKGNFQMAK